MRVWLMIVFVTVFVCAGCRQEQQGTAGEEGDVAQTAERATPEGVEQPALEEESAAGPDRPTTDEDMIENAMSAAPEAVARDATIITLDENGQMRTLRTGTGSFTCMPDGPSPGNDPMCLDPIGVEWAQAWMAHKDPPAGKVGFGYMLQGGSDASNTDPFATGPVEGETWVDTGPHVMILNPPAATLASYPTQAGDPSRPFVMWPNTPYAHLMIPVD